MNLYSEQMDAAQRREAFALLDTVIENPPEDLENEWNAALPAFDLLEPKEKLFVWIRDELRQAENA